MKTLGWMRLRFRVAMLALRQVFASPAYVALAALASLSFLGILIWALNLQLLGFIFARPELSLLEKLAFVGQGYVGYLMNLAGPLPFSGLLFSILAGINLAMLVWVLRRQARAAGSGARRSGIASVAALLGSGCAACGTGILAPVLAAATAGGTVFSSTRFLLVSAIGTILNVVGIALMLYSIAGLSKTVLSVSQAKTRQ